MSARGSECSPRREEGVGEECQALVVATFGNVHERVRMLSCRHLTKEGAKCEVHMRLLSSLRRLGAVARGGWKGVSGVCEKVDSERMLSRNYYS